MGKDLALLIIRIASALAFLYHGAGVLFGAFGGPGAAGFAGFTRLSLTTAYLVGLAQFCGGLAMLTGIFARIGAVCVAVVMVGAIQLVHLKNGFDIGRGGMEYALTQLLIALAILVAGAGKLSLAPKKIANW
jgi:putative oxidoreductase